jgi:predicted N-acetyltransferase YhbS
MPPLTISIRPAKPEDLEAINRIVEAAVMTWDLPERVKRLSLSSYRYNALDLEHFNMVVAEAEQQHIIGIAAWEQADARDIPAGQIGLMLHGIYVDPAHHYQGIGRQLFQYAEQAARQQHYDGVLVKAQTGAEGFFLAQGMHRLPVENSERHYANRYWKRVNE